VPIYVAMLRGINVSGQKTIKMEDLRASFGALGFSMVRTYVQSGNVVFEAPKNLPAKAALGKLDALNVLPDQFRVKGREIYLYCPNGYGRTKLSNVAFEKLLSLEATTRNWKTVNTLAEMSSE